MAGYTPTFVQIRPVRTTRRLAAPQAVRVPSVELAKQTIRVAYVTVAERVRLSRSNQHVPRSLLSPPPPSSFAPVPAAAGLLTLLNTDVSGSGVSGGDPVSNVVLTYAQRAKVVGVG